MFGWVWVLCWRSLDGVEKVETENCSVLTFWVMGNQNNGDDFESLTDAMVS